MMSKTIKYSLRVVLGVLITIAVYTLLLVLFSAMSAQREEADCMEDQTIYIRSSIIHVDLIIPVEQLPEELLNENYLTDSTLYVGFGWGDRDYVLNTPTWDDFKLNLALRSLLLNTVPIMHVIRYDKKPDPSWNKLLLCKEQQKIIFEHISESFEFNPSGDWIPIEEHEYPEHDFFYESKGSYNGLRTCNTWVNDAFKKAKVETALWTSMPFGILWHIDTKDEG